MLVLGAKKEPKKIVLREAVKAAKGRKAEPEAFVIMAPITKPMRRRAMMAARKVTGKVDDIAELTPDLILDAADAASAELIRLGMIDWGGIGDANGKPVALTPDRDTRLKTANDPERPTGTIDLLLADVDLLEKIEADYSVIDRVRQAEKNASSPSQNGTGGAATRAKTTAGFPARPKATKTAAANARTGSTRSNRKPAKKSGKR